MCLPKILLGHSYLSETTSIQEAQALSVGNLLFLGGNANLVPRVLARSPRERKYTKPQSLAN